MGGTGDILGNRQVLDRLWDALRRGTLHHALLFEGPSGVGKREVAVRLAMAANCTADTADPPCGTCPTCRQIAQGHHPDVVLVEPSEEHATLTISVAQIREIVRQAGYHRYNARRRFYILDPAEAMADPAANALLKTLEEPPAGTGFILIANHSSTLLPTIVSRCQRVRFAAVATDELERWLAARRVKQPELVARLALGCPGRALALKGPALAKRLKARDELVDVLAAPLADQFKYAQKLCRGARKEWTPRVEAMLDQLEDLLRDVVVRGSGSELSLLNLDRAELVDAWTAALWPTGVVACTRSLDDARENLERNVSGRTIVDAVTTRFAAELGYASSSSSS